MIHELTGLDDNHPIQSPKFGKVKTQWERWISCEYLSVLTSARLYFLPSGSSIGTIVLHAAYTGEEAVVASII
jgi:hypothetical protein